MFFRALTCIIPFWRRGESKFQLFATVKQPDFACYTGSWVRSCCFRS